MFWPNFLRTAKRKSQVRGTSSLPVHYLEEILLWQQFAIPSNMPIIWQLGAQTCFSIVSTFLKHFTFYFLTTPLLSFLTGRRFCPAGRPSRRPSLASAPLAAPPKTKPGFPSLISISRQTWLSSHNITSCTCYLTFACFLTLGQF